MGKHNLPSVVIRIVAFPLFDDQPKRHAEHRGRLSQPSSFDEKRSNVNAVVDGFGAGRAVVRRLLFLGGGQEPFVRLLNVRVGYAIGE